MSDEAKRWCHDQACPRPTIEGRHAWHDVHAEMLAALAGMPNPRDWKDTAIDYWKVQAGKLRAERDNLATMLRRLEWAGSPAGECPECGGAPEREITEGAEPIPGTFLVRAGTGTKRTIPAWHTPDCRLSRLLSELK